MVEIDAPDRNWLEPKLRAVALIQLRIGERKIDLVVTDRSAERESQLIVQNARNGIAHEYETEDLRGLFGAVLSAVSQIFETVDRIAT